MIRGKMLLVSDIQGVRDKSTHPIRDGMDKPERRRVFAEVKYKSAGPCLRIMHMVYDRIRGR